MGDAALPERLFGAHLRAVGDPRRGFGSSTARRTILRLRDLGANTVGFVVEARCAGLEATQIRGPSAATMAALRRGLEDARNLGLETVLVPQLMLDDGEWRGHIRFPVEGDATQQTTEQLEAWWRSYGDVIESVARLAGEARASVLSIGVELKGLSALPSTYDDVAALVMRVRQHFHGVVTYSANWDEAEDVVFWDLLDVAAVQAYYPLLPEPVRGAEAIARRLSALASKAGRDVLVLEVGYRSSETPHLKPWEWPDEVDPVVDDEAQAIALAAVFAHWPRAKGVRGVLVWVVPTDPDDPASEPRHGFNPLNKPAEEVLRRAFGALTSANEAPP